MWLFSRWGWVSSAAAVLAGSLLVMTASPQPEHEVAAVVTSLPDAMVTRFRWELTGPASADGCQSITVYRETGERQVLQP